MTNDIMRDLVKGKQFLVTGAAGFIGSNLVEALIQLGAKVRGLDDFSNGKKSNIEPFTSNPSFEMMEGDIRDSDTCMKACESVDYVLHQAAWGSVPRSMKMPLLYNMINVQGTINMMEAATKSNVKRFVYASSSSVYGDSPILPKQEGQEGNVLSPYALTKWIDELYGKLYFDRYSLQTIGLRYFNVFGRRQDPYSAYAAVIPLFVKNLLEGKAPVIFGDGTQSRDFTYIDNVIEANLKACFAEEQACGKAYNIAFGENTTLNDLYQEICKLLNINIDPVYGPSREGDIPHSLADITQARTLLGYDPKHNIRKGLELTMEWYVEFLSSN